MKPAGAYLVLHRMGFTSFHYSTLGLTQKPVHRLCGTFRQTSLKKPPAWPLASILILWCPDFPHVTKRAFFEGPQATCDYLGLKELWVLSDWGSTVYGGF